MNTFFGDKVNVNYFTLGHIVRKKSAIMFPNTTKVLEFTQRNCKDSFWNLKRHLSRKHESVLREHAGKKAKDQQSQVAERLGNRVSQKVAGLIPGRVNGIVSLGKALYPTYLGGMSLYLL